MLVQNTDYEARHPWPEDMFIQGGRTGVVFSKDFAKTYQTAFVEAFPEGTFIRGEGNTIDEAEDDAWEKYRKESACQHEFESRHYTNGAGICKHCGGFRSKVFTGEQLGQFCSVCGVGTTWSYLRASEEWRCKEHAGKQTREELDLAVEAGGLEGMFAAFRLHEMDKQEQREGTQ